MKEESKACLFCWSTSRVSHLKAGGRWWQGGRLRRRRWSRPIGKRRGEAELLPAWCHRRCYQWVPEKPETGAEDFFLETSILFNQSVLSSVFRCTTTRNDLRSRKTCRGMGILSFGRGMSPTEQSPIPIKTFIWIKADPRKCWENVAYYDCHQQISGYWGGSNSRQNLYCTKTGVRKSEESKETFYVYTVFLNAKLYKISIR